MRATGFLLLADPLRPTGRLDALGARLGRAGERVEFPRLAAAGAELFSRAQSALYALRQDCARVCAAGEGEACALALALAAQLPLERLLLIDLKPFRRGSSARDTPTARALGKIDAHARRNLSLIVSEIALMNADAVAAGQLARGLGRRELECIAPEPAQPLRALDRAEAALRGERVD